MYIFKKVRLCCSIFHFLPLTIELRLCWVPKVAFCLLMDVKLRGCLTKMINKKEKGRFQTVWSFWSGLDGRKCNFYCHSRAQRLLPSLAFLTMSPFVLLANINSCCFLALRSVFPFLSSAGIKISSAVTDQWNGANCLSIRDLGWMPVCLMCSWLKEYPDSWANKAFD